jgi:hypothetical protein
MRRGARPALRVLRPRLLANETGVRKRGNSGGSEEEAMTINDLPAIMGTVLIVAGLALVGIYTRFRTEGSEKSVQAGALLIVVGAVLLGLSLFVPHAK